VRYADDDFVVHCDEEHAQALREDVAALLAPLGLRLSRARIGGRGVVVAR
jgi:RNA-directed DNA polymerase